MAWMMAAAAVVGSVVSASAAKDAGNTQAAAANRATDAQLQMFDTINKQGEPFRQAGSSAINLLSGYAGVPGYSTGTGQQYNFHGQTFNSRDDIAQSLKDDYLRQTGNAPAQADLDSIDKYVASATPIAGTGTGGELTGSLLHQFGPQDLQTNLAPNYQFMLDQGLGAVRNQQNASGSLVSGNTMKALNDYAQNYAGNAYQNAFNNFNTNQSNIYNRLAGIAGLGQQANQTTANAGTQISGNAANTMVGAGTAQAAGTVGAANAFSGGLGNASSWYGLNSFLKPQGAASGTQLDV